MPCSLWLRIAYFYVRFSSVHFAHPLRFFSRNAQHCYWGRLSNWLLLYPILTETELTCYRGLTAPYLNSLFLDVLCPNLYENFGMFSSDVLPPSTKLLWLPMPIRESLPHSKRKTIKSGSHIFTTILPLEETT